MRFLDRPFPGRRILAALAIIERKTDAMTIDVSKLTAAVGSLQTAATTASAALDDIAAKLAAIAPDDPAVQDQIDAATAAIGAVSSSLSASAAKDDPQPAPAPAS